jgi:hypothetical protein
MNSLEVSQVICYLKAAEKKSGRIRFDWLHRNFHSLTHSPLTFSVIPDDRGNECQVAGTSLVLISSPRHGGIPFLDHQESHFFPRRTDVRRGWNCEKMNEHHCHAFLERRTRRFLKRMFQCFRHTSRKASEGRLMTCNSILRLGQIWVRF